MALETVYFIQQAPIGGSPFTGCADATISEANPTTNYGSNNTIRVDSAGSGNNLNIWIRFDIYDWINPEYIVQDAKLALYVISVASNNAGAMRTYRCLKEPIESEVTWNAANSSLNWKTAGARSESATEDDNDDVTKADRRSQYFEYSYVSGTGFKDVIPYGVPAFKSIVQGWIDGSIESTRGLIIDAVQGIGSPAADVTFGAQNHANINVRPRLWVKYYKPSSTGPGKVNEFNRVNFAQGA